ncbi:MAG: sialidase family protein [Armatimonadota bacterium]|nr:glycoside hydrolase [Armatimonadota bacterium]MCX7777234.1 glycoside hydrolase [Armatimonadota bacterium]MDW8024649.1 sialidase family protein [Armatimonadota bacterium]
MHLYALIGAMFSSPSVMWFSDPNAFELLSVRRIWDAAPHNAFTDLVLFRGRWYCAFREGQAHVSDDGKLRLLASDDGEGWHSVALLEWAGGDLRDPKLSISADGKLVLNSAVRFASPINGKSYREFMWALSPDGSPWKEYAQRFLGLRELRHQSLTWLSEDGQRFVGPYACVSGAGTWRWSITWHDGFGYSIGYGGKDSAGCLYRTSDGKSWEAVAHNIFPDGRGNEASLVFDEDGTGYCLLRDGGKTGKAHFGISSPPYDKWEWRDLGVRIGGPKLALLPNGSFICGVRLYDDARTSICAINITEGKMAELLRLPSGGDTSYTGMVYHNGVLWVSYYSSHEGKSSIYLAKVRLSVR